MRPRTLPLVMDRTPRDVSAEAIARYKDGLSEYLTADGVQRLLEAVDSEAVLEQAVAEDVPTEEVARIVGRLVGRVVAKEATSYLPLGQVIEATVGRPLGEKIGEGAVSLVIEYGSVAAILARVSVASDQVGFGERPDRAKRFDVRERASSVRERLPGPSDLPDFGRTDPVWEAEDATTIPVTEEAAED